MDGSNIYSLSIFKQTHSLCYILYYDIDQWGFHCILLQTTANGGPDPQAMTWTDTYDVVVSTTWRPLPHTEDNVRTCCTSFLHDSTPGTVGLVSYTHEVYVTCYFCYMFFNTYLCMYIILLRMVVGLRTQFWTLLDVWGVWELRWWHLTRKRLRRIGGSKYRWSWTMITYHIHTTHIHTTYIQNSKLSHPSFRTFHITQFTTRRIFSSDKSTHNQLIYDNYDRLVRLDEYDDFMIPE
jgi:hypothetical protein